MVIDRDEGAVARAADAVGGRGFHLDITDEAGVERAGECIEDDVGPVSALVVSAAQFQDIEPAESLPTATWQRILDVNLTANFVVNRVFGAGMVRRRHGSIVNLASIAALGSMPTQAYSTSKAAIVQLTKNLAGEWGRAGVRVNAVSPGSTLVPRVEERLKSGRYAADPGEFTALGRMVQPNEVAEAIYFLLSERASAITGVNLVVDAGWQIASTWAQFGGPRRFPDTS